MDYNKAALEMHETHKGKVGIVSKVEVATRDDLSTAYTPGVAEPCRKIKENPEDVYKRQNGRKFKWITIKLLWKCTRPTKARWAS